MTRADFYGGLVLCALFGAALWEATTFQYGSEFAPGPGFAPVWLSTVGLVVSLFIVVFGWRARRDPRAKEPEALEGRGLVRVVLTLAGLAAMLLLAPAVGLVAALAAFLVFLTLVVQRHSLAVGLGASLGTVSFVYVVFVYLLDVPVPKGPWGF